MVVVIVKTFEKGNNSKDVALGNGCKRNDVLKG
jgi:hypothetical protein